MHPQSHPLSATSQTPAPDSVSAPGSPAATPSLSVSRRGFLATGAAAATALGVSGTTSPRALAEQQPKHTAPPRRILKTLKVGMVNIPGSLTEKFKALKAAGYEGIELDSPGIDVEATQRAVAESGLMVDGSVCSTHWQITHTSPDPAQREQALKDLQTALRQTHAVGGHTVLLVVGHGKDGPESEIWPRAVENIRKAVPLAAELGMTIAIENVWNHFLYDHDGPENQTADKFAKFVDEFNSPFVGMQFDIGNHWKYGSPGEWIRTLNTRIVKLDIKGFSRAENRFKDILDDDIDWADVRQALDDIRFEGWAAAEVGGGNAERLATIAGQIDRALNIG
jgi:L-ribulose-5-phosphate 3-epimerase